MHWRDRHEQWSKEHEEKKAGERLAIWMMLLILVVLFVGDALWNAYVYDDWTCMFAKCVKVKEVP